MSHTYLKVYCTVTLKLKDFSRSRSVTYTVKIVVYLHRCTRKTEILLPQTYSAISDDLCELLHVCNFLQMRFFVQQLTTCQLIQRITRSLHESYACCCNKHTINCWIRMMRTMTAMIVQDILECALCKQLSLSTASLLVGLVGDVSRRFDCSYDYYNIIFTFSVVSI